ncbi:hypothetical protein [Paenibacillus methanolicus]|uniref:Uncharacterized protein n=1 Tax=Paenibacillus methanolicus TaxID=582686 RepID=A0A5S5C1L4_9BACL|nr:hypothetical protein [Paenibacillus methanolicus]TYP73325.1 hypothetical protein BCM02_107309 [Paenibacillus methanolicus]
MKQTFALAGSVLFVCGTFLFGLVYWIIARYAPNMSGWIGVQLLAALNQTLLTIPFILSIVFMLVGAALFAVVLKADLDKEKTTKQNIRTEANNRAEP